MQAHLPQLRPPACDMMAAPAVEGGCEEASGVKAGIFFAALYLVALGSGCLKPNIIAHGADQFRRGGGDGDGDDGGDGKRLSSYFNAAYFSFCVGELVALTVLVWVQTRSGMDVGFGVSAAAMAVGLVSLVAGVFFYRNKPPQGSIFMPIAKVRTPYNTIVLYFYTLSSFLFLRGKYFFTRPLHPTRYMQTFLN